MRLINAQALFRAWCYLAPVLAVAHATPSPELSLAWDASPDPQPSPTGIPQLGSESGGALGGNSLMIRQPPNIMAWLGSIGGVLGIISFTDSYMQKLIDLFRPYSGPAINHPNAGVIRYWESQRLAGKHFPQMKGEAPWKIGIQVGLDGTGLQGAGGNFPQVCLWNRHGQLIGYNDQIIRVVEDGYPFDDPSDKWQLTDDFNRNIYRENMPQILSGGLTTRGIWPAPGQEKSRDQQATYVTLIKRHFDAICVASVFMQWPDKRIWLFDGAWGRASNVSWYYSYIFTSDRRDDGTCFWLDHRGDLTHKKDLEEEYIGASVKGLGRKPNSHYPDYLWASKVLPEKGIPEGADLNDGMRENGVDQYQVPLGIKFHAPAFKAAAYGEDFDNLTVLDFATNPGKMTWITEPSRKNVRRGNPVLPLMHPRASLSDKDPELIWEDVYKQQIPVDCLTDFYYDENEKLLGPGSDRRCVFLPKQYCGNAHKSRRSLDGVPNADQPPPSLQERHARTLVNDQNPRSEGSSAKKLCQSPWSIGPSYANHAERFFCRMTDKTLWPFCDSPAGLSHDCFDAEAEVLVEKNKPVGKRSHQWDAIEDWHSEKRFKRAA